MSNVTLVYVAPEIASKLFPCPTINYGKQDSVAHTHTRSTNMHGQLWPTNSFYIGSEEWEKKEWCFCAEQFSTSKLWHNYPTNHTLGNYIVL